MTTTEKTYQSILQKLSAIPVEHLEQVDEFLAQFSRNGKATEETRKAVLNLAGSWGDMSEGDFNEFLTESKVYKTAKEAFQAKHYSMKELVKNIDLSQLGK
ncbi:hypothetical protein [Larkinella punicea]|uniref:DUF2281 domain-containing protein n=1 Tax=Larkinella punicea TaxID=2315727 RepID=A0A368JRB0_9BACT|nr:hypothetical protein [Larkinella punicea]RCR69506.1 hypothetical protein DUE52_11690 [Larkinella punicea]